MSGSSSEYAADLPAGTVVLVADDDDLVRDVAVDMCESLGFSVIAARNGREALTCLESHPEIALLFSDIRMPDLDGIALSRETMKRRPDVKIVLVTGYSNQVSPPPGISVLRKPYHLEAAQALFQSLLANRR